MSGAGRLTVAVHALCWIELADRRGESPLSSARVAESLASHPVQVRRLLAELRARGLVTATRGPGSGWRLARPADEITVADVHRALGTPAPFALHAHPPKPDCPVGASVGVVLADLYDGWERLLTTAMADHTIASVLDATLYRRPPGHRE
ncbi:MAG: Rrf2 family transcriptional regulator [Phycicoccus sp.]